MTLELLDPNNLEMRAEYERAFYAGFQRVPGNRLVRKLWVWDDEAKRVATRVPYEDQIIYIIRRNGAIDGAMAVNVTLNTFQSVAYGFSPPADKTGACETLTFFAVSELRLSTRFGFWRDCWADLNARGFGIVYTTVGAPVYKIYVRFGITLLAQTEIEGEQRFFLTFDTARSGTYRSKAAQPPRIEA
jgi:hypothetical protein